MAIKSGFFMSVNGDRKYNSAFFAEYFATFIGNGVFPNPSNGLQIISNGDMTVTMKPGKAWINGYYINNNADYILKLDNADGVLNRIDRIVLQLNFLNREIIPVVKKGTPASTPVAPALQRDADVYEIALADIAVNQGSISISQSNISDLRLNTEYCGVVHGLVDQVDTTSIFNQYLAWFDETKTNANSELSSFQTQKQEEFQTWFDSVKGILEGDVAANLATQISTLSEIVTSHKNDYVKHPAVVTATNSGNAYSVTLDPAPSTYENGMGLVLTINADSTGACTVNVNRLGAKPIKKANGNAVTNLKKNGVYTLRYSKAQSAFILQGEGGEYGTATAAQVLQGYTLGTDNGIVNGLFSEIKSIQSGTLTTTHGKIGTIPIQGVDPTKTLVFFTINGTRGTNPGNPDGYMDVINATTVKYQFFSNSNWSRMAVSYYIVEFNTVKSIQKILVSSDIGYPNETTISISEVNTSKSFIYSPCIRKQISFFDSTHLRIKDYYGESVSPGVGIYVIEYV